MIAPTFTLGAVAIETHAYASQGSAVLGIRDSGKSYTATSFAEHLMEAGVPILAIDPIGIWRFLRVPGAGRNAKGYPVVVAGGEQPDLPLSPVTVQDLVRAAMRERVSLVLDLYSMDLSKADWRRIVATAVRTLLYENKGHGLRHIFIEEAAEFVPQIIPKDGVTGQVYAEIEKLARMGGNAMLGYTLINQRAEQVNKAVLELCANLFLHRQTGKNSIDSLGKWLKVAGASVDDVITKSLPTLAPGECWAWVSGTTAPVRTTVPPKRSFHPDRRALHGAIAATAPSAPVDVAGFVAHMAAALPEITREAEANDPVKLSARIRELERLLDVRAGASTADVDEARAEAFRRGKAAGYQDGVRTLGPIHNRIRAAAGSFEAMARDMGTLDDEIEALSTGARDATAAEDAPRAPVVAPARPLVASNGAGPAPVRAPAAAVEGITGPQQRILNALVWLASVRIEPAPRITLALLADASPNSSSYANNLGALRTAGLIDYPSGGTIVLTGAGRASAVLPRAAPTSDLLHSNLMAKLPAPQWRILEILIKKYPRALSRGALADLASASSGSSSYANNLGALRSFGFIDYPAPGHVVALPVLFVEGRRG